MYQPRDPHSRLGSIYRAVQYTGDNYREILDLTRGSKRQAFWGAPDDKIYVDDEEISILPFSEIEIGGWVAVGMDKSVHVFGKIEFVKKLIKTDGYGLH